MVAKDQPCLVITKPFKLEGDRLEVNVDARGGMVQVDLLDEVGAPLPGFSGRDAPQYRAVDNLRLQPVRKNLSGLKGLVARTRFRLRNARLYALQVQ